ncbi:hypothetical protein F5Y11DRAFT_242672 [Daldinia sp. FL1419]|nr:hypothetical protein F5Y11DRAFT_242672 [Daldinia sp. FL1419]
MYPVSQSPLFFFVFFVFFINDDPNAKAAHVLPNQVTTEIYTKALPKSKSKPVSQARVKPKTISQFHNHSIPFPQEFSRVPPVHPKQAKLPRAVNRFFPDSIEPFLRLIRPRCIRNLYLYCQNPSCLTSNWTSKITTRSTKAW